MPQMFQQALWIGGTHQQDEAQEVDFDQSMTGARLERCSAPEHFQKGSSQLEYGKGDIILTQKTSALASAFSFRQIDGSLDVKLSLRGGSTGPSRGRNAAER